MNYAYTSSRVRALENSLPSADLIKSLEESKNIDECIENLNSAGFEGKNADEIVSAMKKRRAKLISELIEDKKEIEVIFYEKQFHNLKAAVKKMYSKSNADMFYDDVPVSGNEIISAIENNNELSLPDYMAKAAREAYTALMRTGDGKLSDTIADKACLDAMAAFGEKTPHEILKKYVNEAIAAADIKTILRADETDDLPSMLCDCGYFTADALIKAARENSLGEFLTAVGYDGATAENADKIKERRLNDLLDSEKYNIFSPAPAIYFILEYERMINNIRYILILKSNGM